MLSTSRVGTRSVALCTLLALALATCAYPYRDDWDTIQQSGVLRVGMDASFPPFEVITPEGQLVGFDVDLANEIGRRLGLEVQFVPNLPYDGLYDALAVGQVDAIISALVVDPDKMSRFAYSISYFNAGQVLVIPKDTTNVHKIPDLAGRTVAVELGSPGDEIARTWSRRLTGLRVVSLPTAEEALERVALGQAEAALVDHVTALLITGKWDDVGEGRHLVIVDKTITDEPYAIAVRAGSRTLLRMINQALTEIATDGTRERLIAKWLEGN